MKAAMSAWVAILLVIASLQLGTCEGTVLKDFIDIRHLVSYQMFVPPSMKPSTWSRAENVCQGHNGTLPPRALFTLATRDLLSTTHYPHSHTWEGQRDSDNEAWVAHIYGSAGHRGEITAPPEKMMLNFMCVRSIYRFKVCTGDDGVMYRVFVLLSMKQSTWSQAENTCRVHNGELPTRALFNKCTKDMLDTPFYPHRQTWERELDPLANEYSVALVYGDQGGRTQTTANPANKINFMCTKVLFRYGAPDYCPELKFPGGRIRAGALLSKGNGTCVWPNVHFQNSPTCQIHNATHGKWTSLKTFCDGYSSPTYCRGTDYSTFKITAGALNRKGNLVCNYFHSRNTTTAPAPICRMDTPSQGKWVGVPGPGACYLPPGWKFTG